MTEKTSTKWTSLKFDDWMFTSATSIAKTYLQEFDDIITTVIAYDEVGTVYHIPMLFENPKEKEESLMAAKVFMAVYGIRHYCFITGCWVVEQKRNEIGEYAGMDVPPSEHPDRVEALMVLSINKTRNRGCYFKISRDKSGTSIGGPIGEDFSELSGRFTNLLPPDESPTFPAGMRAKVMETLSKTLGFKTLKLTPLELENFDYETLH